MEQRRYRDEADWTGVSFTSIDVGAGCKRKKYMFGDYHYSTRGELQLAMLLHEMGIAFTPDVLIPLELPNGKPRNFVPDFIFGGHVYLWRGRNHPTPIHGIEVKGKGGRRDFSPRALETIALLRSQRNINILLLSDAQIKSYFNRPRDRRGAPAPRFPLHRLDLLEAKK